MVHFHGPSYQYADYSYRGFSIHFVSADEVEVGVRVCLPDGSTLFECRFYHRDLQNEVNKEIDFRVSRAEKVVSVVRSTSVYR